MHGPHLRLVPPPGGEPQPPLALAAVDELLAAGAPLPDDACARLADLAAAVPGRQRAVAALLGATATSAAVDALLALPPGPDALAALTRCFAHGVVRRFAPLALVDPPLARAPRPGAPLPDPNLSPGPAPPHLPLPPGPATHLPLPPDPSGPDAHLLLPPAPAGPAPHLPPPPDPSGSAAHLLLSPAPAGPAPHLPPPPDPSGPAAHLLLSPGRSGPAARRPPPPTAAHLPLQPGHTGPRLPPLRPGHAPQSHAPTADPVDAPRVLALDFRSSRTRAFPDLVHRAQAVAAVARAFAVFEALAVHDTPGGRHHYRLSFWTEHAPPLAVAAALRAVHLDLTWLHARLVRLRGTRLWLNGWSFADDHPIGPAAQAHLLQAWLRWAEQEPPA